MEKKYYADAFFYVCRNCKKQTIGKHYYAIYELAEMGAAKRAGLLTFTCMHCGNSVTSDRQLVNGEAAPVSKEEALANGIDFESKGQA
jgi:DNA-directed RNA polymerase subunit RPC12/RpoP